MCEDDKNPTLEKIKKKLNEFSVNHLDGNDMCQLLKKIKTDELGNQMIETFKNLKINKWDFILVNKKALKINI